jgi:maleylpyruvate isomerase
VATHLACHGVALASLVTTVARSRHPQPWAIQPADDCLRTCAGLDAIALQERLDESSAQLMTALDLMDEATWEIELKSNGDKYPAKAIILDRLNEVVVHHVDLHLGFDFADVESSLLRALLVWNLTRALPRLAGVELRVDSDEGFSCRVGTGKVVTVRGTEGNIMAWLTGRKGASSVLGAEELSLWGPV